MAHTPTITPLLRYRDVRTAAQWLCEAFGFKQHYVSSGPGDQIHYISLRLGTSFVLVCPVASFAFDELMVQPEDISGASTQLCYLTVANVDEHRSRASAQGARIEIAPQDDGSGGRFYTGRDLEGHLWSFGTRAYNLGGATREKQMRRSRSLRRAGTVAALALAIGGSVLHKADVGGSPESNLSAIATGSVVRDEEAQDERALRLAFEQAAKKTADKLEEERAAAVVLRRTAQGLEAERSQLLQAKNEADRATRAAEARRQEQAQARARTEEALAATRARLESEQKRFLSVDRELAQVQLARQEAEEALANAISALTVERARGADARQAQAHLQETAAQAEAAGRAGRQAAAEADRERALLREELDRQQQTAMLQHEELQQAKAALLAAREEIASLHRALPPPARIARPEERGRSGRADRKARTLTNACVSAARERNPAWSAAGSARLCAGAESSREPVRCFEELALGRVSWGGGRVWSPGNALALCRGTRSAKRILACFAAAVAAGQSWRVAVRQCRASQRAHTE